MRALRVRKIQQKSAGEIEMALSLAERYSSMSVASCLQQKTRGPMHEEPLVDLPLMADKPQSFAVPPGIEVSVR